VSLFLNWCRECLAACVVFFFYCLCCLRAALSSTSFKTNATVYAAREPLTSCPSYASWRAALSESFWRTSASLSPVLSADWVYRGKKWYRQKMALNIHR
jgi:hypothetical protein